MVIGLTGNTGSGKSTAAAFLRDQGAVIIDADAISKEICEPAEIGNRKIREIFGNEFFFFDNRLDRKKLGAYVFANPFEKEKLDAALHPLIKEEIENRINVCSRNNVVVVDCPLLYESGLDKATDFVWLITAPETSKIHRITDRDHLPVKQALDRLESQTDQRELAKKADVVIENTGSLSELKEQINLHYEKIKPTKEEKTR